MQANILKDHVIDLGHIFSCSRHDNYNVLLIKWWRLLFELYEYVWEWLCSSHGVTLCKNSQENCNHLIWHLSGFLISIYREYTKVWCSSTVWCSIISLAAQKNFPSAEHSRSELMTVCRACNCLYKQALLSNLDIRYCWMQKQKDTMLHAVDALEMKTSSTLYTTAYVLIIAVCLQVDHLCKGHWRQKITSLVKSAGSCHL